MAKPKIAPKAPAGDKIPLSRIQLTWTPPKIYDNDTPEPITIGGARLAWLLRARGAEEPGKHWTPTDELGLVELRLRGLSELLGALSDTVGSNYDDQAILCFLRDATAALVRDVQNIDPALVRGVVESASITITDKPTAAVA
jgi:hypothetical protein